jgi:DNA-binding CsgD family transcriptional regulator
MEATFVTVGRTAEGTGMRGLAALPNGWFMDSGRLPVRQMRQLHSVLAILRWVGLAWVGILGLLTPPRSQVALALLIVWIALYNAWGMYAGNHSQDQSILRIAWFVTLLDQLTYFVFVAIFTGAGSGIVYAIYTFMLVEAIAIDGIRGAIQGVGLFVAGFGTVQAIRAVTLHLPFPGAELLLWSLYFTFGATTIAAVDKLLLGRPGLAGPAAVQGPSGAISVTASELRLSDREREVLRLVAEGYSNAMMANRLHLSESTIKTHVESLLAHLNVRNRAEAVAAASRLRLL